MKLSLQDVVSRHENKPCVVALHGPSLNASKNRISELQKKNKILRISVNEWYEYFDEKPDYWVVSNSEYTIQGSLMSNHIWKERNYPHDIFNKMDIPLLYNETADLTDKDLIAEKLKCDYLSYDTRHFKKQTCFEILKNFKEHYEKERNLNFKYYGNNSQMWQKPDVSGFPDWYKNIHGHIASGWSRDGKCCANASENLTIQEELQNISGHSQHMGPGQTVGIYALIFAVLMRCNPIYFVGLDLDYSAGYATPDEYRHHHNPNAGNIGHWKKTFKEFLLDDMRILNESAEMMGINIINLNANSWYNSFTNGSL
jgi:hypothetical protein